MMKRILLVSILMVGIACMTVGCGVKGTAKTSQESGCREFVKNLVSHRTRKESLRNAPF